MEAGEYRSNAGVVHVHGSFSIFSILAVPSQVLCKECLRPDIQPVPSRMGTDAPDSPLRPVPHDEPGATLSYKCEAK